MMSASTQHFSANNQLGLMGPRFMRIGFGAGAILLVISFVIGFFVMDDHGAAFYRSYLVGFAFICSICLGGLWFVLVHHAAKAGWSVTVRRLSEAVAANFNWLWILFLPIAAGMLWGHMYHWNEPGITHPASPNYDELIAHKAGFLNPTFWLIRAAFMFGLWFFVARFYWRRSVLQDTTGNIDLTHQMERFAPLAIGLVFLTQALASIDWIMTLEPHWFSTMYPVYFFAASTCGFFAMLIIMAVYLVRRGKLRNEVTTEHFQDMGKMLFAFGIVFWAYIAFSQYMLIWYANIPEETMWFMARQIGGWQWISLLLLFGHFVFPFLLLVTRHTKRNIMVLAVIAAGMLFMHFIDIVYLVKPHVPNEAVASATTYDELRNMAASGEASVGYGWSIVDVTCLLGMTFLLIGGTARQLSRCSLIPIQDPRLGESLAFENM